MIDYRELSEELAAALQTFAELWGSHNARSSSKQAQAVRVAVWDQVNVALDKHAAAKATEKSKDG